MWIPDGRGGSIRILREEDRGHDDLITNGHVVDLQARIAGKFPDREKQALFLVEQEETAGFLIGRERCAAYPTHGPGSIRILANYAEALSDIPVIIVFQNDDLGRTWALTAARIITQFNPCVRMWKIYESVETYLKKQTPDDMELEAHKLKIVRPEDIPYDPNRGGINPALRAVNMTGCRLLADAVGVWEDMDTDEVLNALDDLRIDLPTIWLEDPSLPAAWRVRLVPWRRPKESLKEYELRSGY